MQQWTTVPVPYARRHAEDYVSTREQEWTAGRHLTFAIDRDGRFAGSIDLRPDGAGGAWVGYGLGPWARGRGTTERALKLVLSWGFQALDLQVVHWQAMAGNWASRRVAWRVGFRVEGTVRSLLPARGLRADAWVGSLLRGDGPGPAHDWLVPPVVTGGGVVLRPHRLDDVAAMAQACRDPATQQWLPLLPDPYTTTDARAHLEQIAEEHAVAGGLYWAFGDATDGPRGPLLGEIGLFGLGRGLSRSGELGYWVHPRGRRRGLATQAIRLASRHALLPREEGGLGLARVVVRAAVQNLPSQQAALRAGFHRVGVDRDAELLRDGTVADLVRFDLLAREGWG